MIRQTLLKAVPVAALVSLLFVLGACSEKVIEEDALAVVARAEFSMGIGGNGEGTKASVSGGYLYWQPGDKMVMASNGQINGTLVCTSVDASGHALFSGDIANFTPAAVNLYFLGNRNIEGMNPQFDFSLQSGICDNVSSYVFLKKTGLELVKGADNSYSPLSDVEFEGMTSLLTLKLDPAGSPADDGAVATQARIDGLKNSLAIDLATGNVTVSYMKALDGTTDQTSTTVAPGRIANCANSYVVAVIPQNAQNLTMSVNYLRTDGTYQYTLWSNISWDLSAKAGKAVHTNWTGGKAPAIAESSLKNGYRGQAVTGGENADGLNHKDGYGGANADGSTDYPLGNKSGYKGVEVY